MFFFCHLHIFGKKIFSKTTRISNSSDLNQAGHSFKPGLGQNCLPMLSAPDQGASAGFITDEELHCFPSYL